MLGENDVAWPECDNAVKDATAMAIELRKDFDDLVECTYARLMSHNPLTGKAHTDLKELVIRLRKKWELSE